MSLHTKKDSLFGPRNTVEMRDIQAGMKHQGVPLCISVESAVLMLAEYKDMTTVLMENLKRQQQQQQRGSGKMSEDDVPLHLGVSLMLLSNVTRHKPALDVIFSPQLPLPGALFVRSIPLLPRAQMGGLPHEGQHHAGAAQCCFSTVLFVQLLIAAAPICLCPFLWKILGNSIFGKIAHGCFL